jgi:hypothetical protein
MVIEESAITLIPSTAILGSAASNTNKYHWL